MSIGDELILRARAESEQYLSSTGSPAGSSTLRAEANALFESLPEPPAYRRANDPARATAEQVLPKAVALLSRIYAAQGAPEPDPRLESLAHAVEAHVRALAALSAGEISAGDNLVREAWDAARGATREGSLFQMESPGSTPVFDPVTGNSRYDPRPEPSLSVQLFCSNCRQPGAYTLSPRYPVHRFTCSACKRPFTGHFGELRNAEARPTGKSVHHSLRVEQAGTGQAVLEFDDVSGEELAAAPRDLLVLLYAGTGSLAAVENLTTGRVLWVQPKGACFIVTAAFGEEAPELDRFRAFRDQVLLPTGWGRLLVRGYYAAGPALAAQVVRRPRVKSGVQHVLRRVHRHLPRSR